MRRRRHTRRRAITERRALPPVLTGAVPQRTAIDDRPGLVTAVRERGDGAGGERIDRLECVAPKLPEPALGPDEDARVHAAMIRLVSGQPSRGRRAPPDRTGCLDRD